MPAQGVSEQCEVVEIKLCMMYVVSVISAKAMVFPVLPGPPPSKSGVVQGSLQARRPVSPSALVQAIPGGGATRTNRFCESECFYQIVFLRNCEIICEMCFSGVGFAYHF